MKKLMFAAVAATMAGFAIAENGCGLDPTPTQTCLAPVWDFQLVLRADSACYCAGTPEINIPGETCGLGGQHADPVCVSWRVLETRVFTGNLYACQCYECALLTSGLSALMFDQTRRVRYFAGKEGAAPTFTFTDPYRFGPYGEQWASEGTIKFQHTAGNGNEANLAFAGHGSFDISSQIPMAFAGFVTGTLGDPYPCDAAAVRGTDWCRIYEICQNTSGQALTALMTVALQTKGSAVAYGQLAIQFNIASSIAFTRSNDSLDKENPNYKYSAFVPAWFLN